MTHRYTFSVAQNDSEGKQLVDRMAEYGRKNKRPLSWCVLEALKLYEVEVIERSTLDEK